MKRLVIMRMRYALIYALMCVSVSTFTVQNTLGQESSDQYHERMKWWDDGRFGLFLHWGVYSCFGGEYEGKDYGKEMGLASAEWIYLRSNIPENEYREVARKWNPTDYDPEEWVKAAKAAGMKYIVLTAKHHDGFALFDSEASDWNVMNSSAANRDLIKDFLAACRKYDMKAGLYYSHEKDWFHHSRTSYDTSPLKEEYITFIKNQVTELLTKYGKIDLMWFDTYIKEHEELNILCAELTRKYQPHCIINGRLGVGLGDYINIDDRRIVDPSTSGYKESIMTTRLNWGFDKNDNAYKSSEELISMLSRSACRGSNFLLNIGPSPEGELPLADLARLKTIGNWLEQNGESVYQTTGSPFTKEHWWGSMTISKDSNAVYLHLLNWRGGNISLRGLDADIRRAVFLDSNEEVPFSTGGEEGEVTFFISEHSATHFPRVIKLEVNKKAFDLDHGPVMEATEIMHINRKRITGTITSLDGTEFTLQGYSIMTSDQGYEMKAETMDTLIFTIDEHTQFRSNINGQISLLQNLDLKEGSRYDVVYTPFPDHPKVEIITMYE